MLCQAKRYVKCHTIEFINYLHKFDEKRHLRSVVFTRIVPREDYPLRIHGDCKADRIRCKVRNRDAFGMLPSEKIITLEGRCAEHNNGHTT